MSRRIWWFLGGGIALAVVALVAGPLVYAALQDDAPAARTVQSQPEGAALTEETDGSWTVAEGSTAGYRVDEVLNGADVAVAGTTEQVSGSLVVADGALTEAEVTVDVASIATDNGRRDAYFRDNVMDVAAHPTATFTVTGPVELPELTGTPQTVPVPGELTLTGVTRPVEVELSAVLTPEGAEVSGSVPVAFADFGIEPPDLGFVRVEDAGSIELFLVLTR
ncbi:YceI family protein [Blastococcus xanthinilyticus]|uniref:Polyisoprenoid-binding protein YceI n=1 Tax=Blastococcus xanthinilyticus TaxID=1564164 RepID=A0A5S5CWA5_9ACTN|nr:YceI family protein [Blastococcus xanthinilyticus]TYP87126.1 polyisoprenoid-binding protein YceI [Blastococcus xanthinilyticus]